jgi:hypothetical protein
MEFDRFYNKYIKDFEIMMTEDAILSTWYAHNGISLPDQHIKGYIDDFENLFEGMYNAVILCKINKIEYEEKYTKLIVEDTKNNKIEIFDFCDIVELFEPQIDDRVVIDNIRCGLNKYNGRKTLYFSNDSMILPSIEVDQF